MTNKSAGWILGIAALGMMMGLMSVDFIQMKNLDEVRTPVFIGTMMAHIANVILAFIGGKLIPTTQNQRDGD